MRLSKFFYIVLAAILTINAYIYLQWDVSSSTKSILDIIIYSISIGVGFLMLIRPNFFSEKRSISGYRFLGATLLITGLLRILFLWL